MIFPLWLSWLRKAKGAVPWLWKPLLTPLYRFSVFVSATGSPIPAKVYAFEYQPWLPAPSAVACYGLPGL